MKYRKLKKILKAEEHINRIIESLEKDIGHPIIVLNNHLSIKVKLVALVNVR